MPHEFNLRRGQAVGLIDQVAEDALQGRSLGGEGAGGLDGAGVLVAQGKEAGGGLVSIVRTDTCMGASVDVILAECGWRPGLWFLNDLVASSRKLLKLRSSVKGLQIWIIAHLFPIMITGMHSRR